MEELPIEIINENYQQETPPQEPILEPELPQGEEIIDEPKASPVTPEQLQELGTKLAEMAVSMLQEDFESKLGEKDKELEDGRVGFDEELTKRDEEKMSMEETHKTKSKEMEGKHKEMMKAKDAEISDLKKQLKAKEKENKILLKQVSEALNEED